MALDWSQCPAVESIPGKVSGAWVFRGTRLPVATVIENLEDLSIEEVIEQFDVTREQIAADPIDRRPGSGGHLGRAIPHGTGITLAHRTDTRW